MSKTDWIDGCFLAVFLALGLGWCVNCLADGPAKAGASQAVRCMISEVPVSGYDEVERSHALTSAFRQLLVSEVGGDVGTIQKDKRFQKALQQPELYMEHCGYLTRARVNPKAKKATVSSDADSALVSSDVNADLFLHVKWNMRAVNRMLSAKPEVDESSSPSRNSGEIPRSEQLVGGSGGSDINQAAGGEQTTAVANANAARVMAAETQIVSLQPSEIAVAKMTSLEDIRHPLILLWLNCRDESGHYRLVEDRLDDEDIALVEFLRRGAKRKGIELLFPLVGERERNEIHNIDWTNASNRQAVLRASQHYAADLILTGNVRKRLLSGLWQGDWRFWDGRQWIEYQTTARNRGGVILALWEWLATFKEIAPVASTVDVSENGPILVKLRVAQVDSMELSKEAVEYLRELSPLIHGIELLTLRADGIELRFTFEGNRQQLLTLLQGERGVVLQSATGPEVDDVSGQNNPDELVVVDCRWIKP